MHSKTKGILAILSASLIWAVEAPLAKLAYENSDFIYTTTIRSLLVIMLSFFYILLKKKFKFKLTKKQLSSLIYLGITSIIIADLLYFFALQNSPVINVVLIGHMQPLFVILIGFFVLREDKLTKFDYLGSLFMIIAALLVTTKNITNLTSFRLGTLEDLLVIIATISWSTGAIVTRKYLRNVSPVVTTFFIFLVGSPFLILYTFLSSSFIVPNIYQIIMGIITVIGSIFVFEAYKHIKAVQGSAIQLSTPFFAALFAFLLLGEKLTVMQILGIILLVLGVYFLSKKEEIFI